ncbi:hypothetical protein HK097_007854 [Rhizophlyctis rosea]|uniref:lytic cellulose monooxygenase (C4-dehydrogenating) n=1 Tax=Rhizophlyctis rosea TaxID=64517 RepID=A0AAD5SD31_9FUNG|nr:hypothetical protein HK097_007854 [Rhizophlyctis rosea]
MFKSVLAIASLLTAVQAHYWIDSIDGTTSCMRQLPNPSVWMNPITGNQILTDDVICNTMRPIKSSDIKPPCTYSAGSKMTVQWSQLSSAHPGPFVVYASKKLSSPITWTKIYYEGYNADSKLWAHDRAIANNHKFDFTIPKEMADGDYIFRIEHIALHVAGTPGGVQLYGGCADVRIKNGGGTWADQGIAFPGNYQLNSPGLLVEWWRAQQNPSYYIEPSPAAYNFGSGGSPATSTQPPRTTTTTTTVRTTTQNPVTTTQPPRTTTSTTTRVPVTTTTTTTTRPPTTGGAPLYGQCGGRGWTGATTCAQGTCKFSNEYYSQCLP